MKKRNKWVFLTALLLAVALFALGCGDQGQPGQETAVPQTEAQVTEPEPTYTCPPDGNEDDVTCQGSYTTDTDADAVVAVMEGAELTNAQLRAWYWLTVAQYRGSGAEIQPDYTVPLDMQSCPVDETVASWQQFFLARALNSWHSAQSLALQAEAEGVPTEEAYKPNKHNHEIYLKDIPATRLLYGFNKSYLPNSMHQDYLDGIPALLEELAAELGFGSAEELAMKAAGTDPETLTQAAQLYNLGYMYLTSLSYDLRPGEEEILARLTQESAGETYVDFRHVLLIPQGEVADDGKVTATEESWETCRLEAEEMLAAWEEKSSEADFAELANKNSRDSGSAPSGGAYRQVAKGQLIPVLEDWCFDAARQSGDTALLRSEYGWHLVYFAGAETAEHSEVREDLTAAMQTALLTAAREKYPVQVTYSAISLCEAEAVLSLSDILYPDVAHERFPEVPLYLQQDYMTTMYGYYPVITHGCGITSMAMLATYMTDDELTVPEMCARFGGYCLESGTNFMIFQLEPAGMGFFLRSFTMDDDEAKEALQQGYIVVSLQYRGYWTRGGHFIVIEEITEDDKVRVRDSNIYNYATLEAHKEDLHDWSCIPPMSHAYWIYEKKVTNIPTCTRCGQPEETVGGQLVADYSCEKCRTALLRRDNYLAVTAQ